ncbi:MAG: glycosyltransferase family 2 protein [Clostridia bacterium]|nr:glycosyltransferase family 2 protein [Clostridia bacterium]
MITTENPFVSAMIVVRNEENRIAKCIDSLLRQDYPVDRYEIIVVDGESTDGTLDVVKERIESAKETGPVPEVRIVCNPKKILASGWNIGIKESRGEFVVRPDAHAYVDSDFISKSVETIFSADDADCVGGQMITVCESGKGQLIMEALSSPFGVGGSRFRYSKKPGYVDTVAYGLYRRSVFDRIGFFNETLLRTQDNDLHRRMRDAGMKFYLNPDIRSYYYSRDTFGKLIKQQFNNGKWTMINFLLRPGKMSLRHFIPLGFVLAVLATLIGGAFFHPIWWLTLAGVVLHLICGLLFAVKRTKKVSHVLLLPFVFILMHFSYGTGSVAGFFSAHCVKKRQGQGDKENVS